MYTKIRKFCEACWDNRNLFRTFLVIFAILTVISISDYTIKGGWESTLHYPEESYKVLETEANRIFKTKDFDTEYHYKIDSYYSTSKNLSFTLYGENNTFIEVNINSFGLPDSEISIDRANNNQVSHVFTDILCLLALPAFGSLFAIIIILVVVSAVWFISFIIHKIVLYIQQK